MNETVVGCFVGQEQFESNIWLARGAYVKESDMSSISGKEEQHDILVLVVGFLSAVSSGQDASLETFKEEWKKLKFSYIFTVRVHRFCMFSLTWKSCQVFYIFGAGVCKKSQV